MAFSSYHNILGATSQDQILIEDGSSAGDIRSILLTNVHDTADATVSLSIRNLKTGTETYYLLHTVAIPADTSLLLDNSAMLRFDNRTDKYSLVITVGASDTVDVTIKR